jgi:hypothetical protein
LQDNDPGISEENRRQTRKHLSGRIAVDASISHASVYAARLQLPLEMGGIRLAARNTFAVCVAGTKRQNIDLLGKGCRCCCKPSNE